MKTCPRCELHLSFDSFVVNTARGDGLSGYCRECMLAYNREREARLRAAVIQLLGGECVGCGIIDSRVLDIDHIKGNGGRDRKAGMKQAKFYRYILQGNEDNFQLLCRNCNWIKRLEIDPVNGDRDVPPVEELEIEVKLCTICEQEFQPKLHTTAKYCSAACKMVAYRQRKSSTVTAG